MPGDVVEFRYSYSVKFAPDYGSAGETPPAYVRLYRKWKRWVGQFPADLYFPISRHSQSESYHAILEVDQAFFLDRFEFVDQESTGANEKSFVARADAIGARISGTDEAGSSLGHIQVSNMPIANRAHPAVHAHRMERQPGPTAHIAWLATIAASLSLLLAVSWNRIGPNDISKLWVPLITSGPAISALWFGAELPSATRRQLPIAARIGLWTVIAGSGLMIVDTVAHLTNSYVPLFGQSLAWVIGAVQLASALLAWQQRWRFHLRYRSHQRSISKKYGI